MFHPGRHHSKMHLIFGKKQATEKNGGKRKQGKEGSHQNDRQVARPAKAGSAGSLPTGLGPTAGGAGRKGHNRNIISLLAFHSPLRAPGTPRHSGVTLQ
jgi:hypothetical protein